MKDGAKQLIRAVLFLIVFAVCFSIVSGPFKVDSLRSYEHQTGLYEQKNGSLDAVYVGASDVHAFWQPLFGWADHGIAVWNYSFDSMSVSSILPLVREARKSQPDALYIISLSTYKTNTCEVDTADIHRIMDYQKFSPDKIITTWRYTEAAGIKGFDKLEYFFPIIRFHERWDSFSPWSLGEPQVDFKGSMHTNNFRKVAEDPGEQIVFYDTEAPLSDDVEVALAELLDYLDGEGVSALFVIVPQVDSEEEVGIMNSAKRIVTERGYPCVDFLERYEETGIRTESDYYNSRHTNVHGSLKFSKALGDYLVENYGFSDKRGQPGWESWDESLASYVTYISSYSLPLEREHAPRDYDIPAPAKLKVKASGTGVTVKWEESEGAEGYEIYRKTPVDSNSTWKKVSETDSQTFSYAEEGLEAQTSYTYTVVPYRTEDGVRVYGSFAVNGSAAKTGG